MNRHISPHKLACELVGTQLAQWLGLQVFEFAILDVKPDDEIPLKSGGLAMPGPAFATRAHRGIEWSGAKRVLGRLENPDDISRLVVLDTWTLNWDRYAPSDMKKRARPDNVFLSGENATRGRFRLIAMDQTECFADGPELTARISNIPRIQDERVYGLFPAFIQCMNREVVRAASAKLGTMNRSTIKSFTDRIPREWDVNARLRGALSDLIVSRAAFLADRMVSLLAPACWPQGELDFGKGGET